MKQITLLISLFIALLCLLFLLSTASTNARIITRRDLSYSMYEVPSSKSPSTKLVLTYPENLQADTSAGGELLARVYATWESQDQYFAAVGNNGICKTAEHDTIRIHINQFPTEGLEKAIALARLERAGMLASNGLFSEEFANRVATDYAMPLPEMTVSLFDPINGQIMLTSMRRPYLQIGTAVVFAISLLFILAQAAITLRYAMRLRAWISDDNHCSSCGYEFGQGVILCPECGLNRPTQLETKNDSA